MIGTSGSAILRPMAISHIGALRYSFWPYWLNPRCIAQTGPSVVLRTRSIAPSQRDKSACIGFFTNTGTLVPFRASAISWTANGLTVVLAPIHITSTPAFKQASTCCAFATSVAIGRPEDSLALTNHSRASAPMPSNPLGRVRGFQTPALRM